MTDRLTELPDLEAPEPDALEQSLLVDDLPQGGAPVEALPDDPEVPGPDAFEQSQPAPVYDDDSWR